MIHVLHIYVYVDPECQRNGPGATNRCRRTSIGPGPRHLAASSSHSCRVERHADPDPFSRGPSSLLQCLERSYESLATIGHSPQVTHQNLHIYDDIIYIYDTKYIY